MGAWRQFRNDFEIVNRRILRICWIEVHGGEDLMSTAQCNVLLLRSRFYFGFPNGTDKRRQNCIPQTLSHPLVRESHLWTMRLYQSLNGRPDGVLPIGTIVDASFCSDAPEKQNTLVGGRNYLANKF